MAVNDYEQRFALEPELRRLRGQTRWKPAELETIARVSRVSVDELTGALELV